MDKNRHKNLQRLGLIVVASILLISARFSPDLFSFLDKTPPVLTVWYGPHQTFGPAVSQAWVNVLGNASDPESGVTKLVYRLNGGAPQALSQGPDKRRLLRQGDFNVELDPAALRVGDNSVLIEATNRAGLTQTTTVTLTFSHSDTPLPLPYVIDWAKVKNAQDALQIVDGHWAWDASGIHPLDMGYDRFLTVGDSRWTNYEVLVPVTVHKIDPLGFHDKNSGEQASVSIDMRWIGHSDIPAKCPQPHCGWDPAGDFNKFFFKENGNDFLSLKVAEKEENFPTHPYRFDTGDTYFFRVRVQTTPQGNLYQMRVWEQHKETEPTTWMFERTVPAGDGPMDNPRHGAFALVAHYCDATFGNITVTPLP